jgi:hypothetical protein
VRIPQSLRISVLLAVIFVAGILTGRFTTPRPPVQFATVSGGVATADMLLTRLTAEIDLTEEQQNRMRPILQKCAQQMAQIPPATRQRLEVFTQSVPRMREVLRPDQYQRFDDYVEQTQRRFGRQIRRRGSQ